MNFTNKFDISQKTILVTGATSGIGFATSKLLIHLGCSLYVVGRNTDKLAELETLGNGEVTAIQADLRDNEDLKKVVESIAKIDGFVHSAGVVKNIPLQFISRDYLETERSLNYDSFLFLTQMLMKKRKINSGGSIVPVASIAGSAGIPGLSVYCGSKAALVGTMRVLAKEFSSNKIRVNTISPGMVKTELVDKAADSLTVEALLLDEQKYPLGYGLPDDVAYSIAFLLSDASSWMTGQDIILDGGRTSYV